MSAAANEEDLYSWCVYSGKNHAFWKCSSVTVVGSRKTILKKGRCFLWLQSNHLDFVRRSKHYVSICEPYRGTLGNNDWKQKVSRDDAARVSSTVIRENSEDADVKNVSSNVIEKKRSSPFLQSAKVAITKI